MTLEGKVGDQNYANMVYVDLSNNSQMQIDRKSWNLASTAAMSSAWYSTLHTQR